MVDNLVKFRERTLESIARNVIKKYDSTLLGCDPREIPIEDIIEKAFHLEIQFLYIRNNGRILGETVFEDAPVAIYEKENSVGYTLIKVKKGTIIIDASLINSRNDGRLRFTCAHELAHWLIHNDYYSNLDINAAMKKNIAKSSETDKFIERQADMLAGFLLMPTGQVKMAYNRMRNTTNNPISDLSKLFNVSQKAMEIKLNSCSLI